MGRHIQEVNGVLRTQLLSPSHCRSIVERVRKFPDWRQAQVSVESRPGEYDSLTRPEMRSALILSWTKAELVCREFEQQMKAVVKPLIRESWGVQLREHAGTQVLRYPPRGHYLTHQDAGPDFPRRYFTVLCYLNEDFQGGHTYFPSLGYSAAPLCGSAVIFPARYYHCAQPVLRGEKFVIVSWIEGPAHVPWLQHPVTT
jgi:hypothetical protein